MFNKNFYPTPEPLIQKMYDKIKTSGNSIKYILEPSAGKGDIVKSITEKFYRNIKIDCIEEDIELSNLLIANGHIVVHDDFLTYDTYKKYDAIIMNPPFDNRSAHLLKAIELLKINRHKKHIKILRKKYLSTMIHHKI